MEDRAKEIAKKYKGNKDLYLVDGYVIIDHDTGECVFASDDYEEAAEYLYEHSLPPIAYRDCVEDEDECDECYLCEDEDGLDEDDYGGYFFDDEDDESDREMAEEINKWVTDELRQECIEIVKKDNPSMSEPLLCIFADMLMHRRLKERYMIKKRMEALRSLKNRYDESTSEK